MKSKTAKDKLLHRGHLTSYEKFEACHAFVRSETLSIAWSGPEDNDWREFGSPHLHLVDGTIAHAVDEAREYNCIGPMMHMASSSLSRAVTIMLFDTDQFELAAETPVRELVGVRVRRDFYQTPWTEDDIDMLALEVVLTERSWALVKQLTRLWMHVDGKDACHRMRRELYRRERGKLSSARPLRYLATGDLQRKLTCGALRQDTIEQIRAELIRRDEPFSGRLASHC